MIAPLMEVRGVRHAMLVAHDGKVMAKAGLEDAALTAELALVAAGRAVVVSLGTPAEIDGWQDLLLDFEDGPVLLTPYGDQTILVAFDEVASLGRVRFALRRLLGTGA